MIVYAGVIAHNPVLLRDKKLTGSTTGTAIRALSCSITAARISTLIVISEHAQAFEKKCALQFATAYKPALKRFGIIERSKNYTANNPLIGTIQSFSKHHKLSLQQIATDDLDYGSACALKLIGIDTTHIQIVVIGTSHASVVDHADLGYALKDLLHNSNERIGILVTGDASHKHASDSPAGYSAQAQPFDQGILQTLENRSIAGLTRLSKDAEEAAQCILRPLALAYGMLRRFPAETKILSYEVRNGVGLMNANLFVD